MNQQHLSKIIATLLVCALPACEREMVGESLIGRSISKVEFRYKGEKTIEDERLMNFILSKPGVLFTPDAIDSDVKSLYESGLVKEIRFLAEPDGEYVRLIAEVSTRLPHGPPFCIGNAAFSDKKLAEISGLTKEQPLTLEAMENARQKLHAFYVSRGYADAEVVCRAFQGGDPSPDDFIFEVVEGLATPRSPETTIKATPEQPLTVMPF